MLLLSRSEFSRLRYEHRPPSRATSQPCGNRQDSFESRGSTPPKSLRALRRLQSIPATPCSAWLAPHLTLTPAYRSGFATPSGFRTPSTPSSEIYLPALFHTGAIRGLPCLRRFLPIRSPGDLSAPGVLRAVYLWYALLLSPCGSNRCSLRRPSFEDVSIGRMRCRRLACLARRATRSSLGRYPLRGLSSSNLPCASARLLSWASPSLSSAHHARAIPWLPTFPRARNARTSSSSCSSECHRSEKAARL